MDSAVKIKNLSVTLGGHVKALKSVSLELSAGKTIGFIGPSGAGKTTLIRTIVGRLKTAKGTVTIFDLPAGSPQLRKQVSYMTQELSIYPDLTVEQNLKFFSAMAGQNKKQRITTITEVLKTVDLGNKAGHLAVNLSSGQKQRLSLAIALISSPKLMVLDEPTVGLDPVLRQKLWQLFADLASRGATLIISSHSMDEAQRCDDLVLIRDGQIVAHKAPRQLLMDTKTKTVEDAFLQLIGTKS